MTQTRQSLVELSLIQNVGLHSSHDMQPYLRMSSDVEYQSDDTLEACCSLVVKFFAASSLTSFPE